MPFSDAWRGLPPSKPMTGFLDGSSRMAAATQNFDWSATPLGLPETWPAPLKSAVQMMLASKHAICLFWGRELTMLYNDAYAPFLGAKEPRALGTPFQNIWADVWDDILPMVRSALSGDAVRMEDLPLVMTRNGFEEQTWWTFSYSPLYDEDGKVAGLINIATDTTKAYEAQQHNDGAYAGAQRVIAEQQRAERQQRVLQREMAHRIKNTLAMVTAIVSQTMRHSKSMEEANTTIGDRISALARAQDMLRQTSYESAKISEVIASTLAPHLDRPDRLTVDGPEIELPAQQTLGLSLALFELATNASKYGALSNPSGKATVSWTHADTGDFRLEWRESGGPSVVVPSRKGFGSRLVMQIVPSYFEGDGTVDYDDAGLSYVLTGTVPKKAAPQLEPSQVKEVGGDDPAQPN